MGRMRNYEQKYCCCFGPINRFWKENLNEDNSWKTPEELREHFSDIPLEDEVIVYYGSGVTACPNVLALMETGHSKVKLYAGSWSDWISYAYNPVAAGDGKDPRDLCRTEFLGKKLLFVF
ncbi:hypothetical protein B5S25_09745 [Paenibacillus larvae subsp. pulvifaciens]|nr:hypothetical protein B5S25_09745 [Paenibacillus larvae subsp. pulvifaciens]